MSHECKVNYEESCKCGCKDIKSENVWRILIWKCAKCGQTLASTMLSNSPMAEYYAHKKLIIQCNNKCRKEKGLPEKRTVVTFYDDKGNRILWKDIVEKNKKWEKRMGILNRKPF